MKSTIGWALPASIALLLGSLEPAEAAKPIGALPPTKPAAARFALSDVDHPVVLLDVAGQQLRLVVNTGVPSTVVDARYRQLLGGPQRPPVGKAYTTHEKLPASVGGIELSVAEVFCLDLGDSVAGEGVDGFLGMDFLRRMCVDFDWDQSVLTLSADAPQLPAGRYGQLPLQYNHESVPQLSAKINGRKLQLAVDTGWIGPLTLSAADEKAAFPQGLSRSVSEFGMTPRGILESRVTRATDLELAGAHRPDVLCSVGLPKQTTSKIGAYLLREQRAIFDFPHDRLLLVRRQHAAPAEADMSGIHLLRRRGKTLVYAVDGDSPAAAAQVAAGDQIMAVDEEPAAALTPAQLRELLRSGDGERVTLKFVREGTQRTVELALRKRI